MVAARPKVVTDTDKKVSQQWALRAWLLVVLPAVVCAVVVAAHWPVLSAKAICFDDSQYLAENLLIQNPGWTSAKLFLTEVLEPSTVRGYYQPLAMISLMIDYALGGRSDNLRPFHRTSLMLHAANTVLVIVLIHLLFGRVWVSAAVGLLFGLHPMTVEPVAWVADRKTLLAAFFSLLCLIFYMRFARKSDWKCYAGSMVMYVLALMSKPTSIALPVVMVLMDYWPLKRLNKRTVLQKVPLFAIGGFLVLLMYISQSRTAGVSLPAEFGPERIPLTLCHNIIFYLYKILWPAKLSSHYPFPDPMGLSHPMVLTGVIGTCILICLLVISVRWTRAAMTGWLIFLIAALPTMQIVRFSDAIASDKYVYLPSIGLLMTAASFLAWVADKLRSGMWTIILTIAVLVLAAAETVGTRRQLAYWRDTRSLFGHMLTMSPNAPNVHNMLGAALRAQGEFDAALKHYRRALEIDPDYTNALYNLANAYKSRGQLGEAISLYRRVLYTHPDDIEAHNNLGIVLLSSGNLPKAIEHFRKAVQVRPSNLQSRYNLATALMSNGRLNEAIEEYRRCLEYGPGFAKAHHSLGGVLATLKRFDEALAHFGRASKERPEWPAPLNAMAKILSTHPDKGKRDLSKAVELAERAAELTNYQSPMVLKTLADTYAAQGRYDDAITIAQRGLEIAIAAGSDRLAGSLREKIRFYQQPKRE
jgi:tetratricopeptide (TPR) repeat protein